MKETVKLAKLLGIAFLACATLAVNIVRSTSSGLLQQPIQGFAAVHAVLRVEDPRATVQYALGEKICPNDPLFRTAKAMRTVAVDVIKRELPKVASPYPNVDAVSGTLLNASGMTDSDYYTVLFGLARCSGIAAQIVDERTATLWNAKKNRPTAVPIYRCKYVFDAVNQD